MNNQVGRQRIVCIYRSATKLVARRLRTFGETYAAISDTLGPNIPKPTISGWCRGLCLEGHAATKLKLREAVRLKTARSASIRAKSARRATMEAIIKFRNHGVAGELFNPVTAKLALSLLFLCEGTKASARGNLTFCNSDPLIIKLYLELLRRCFSIDPTKFRCTVQCRADQDTEALESFWASVTDIARSNFYAARIDPRTVGHPTTKKGYMGVCRIDYFSSAVFNEVAIVAEMIREKGR